MGSKFSWAVCGVALAVICAGCRRPSPENGSLLYRKNCARCHVQQMGQSSPAPSLTGYLYRSPQRSVQQIKAVIRKGKGAMPPFGQLLSSREINDLIAYLQTLR